MKLNESKTAVVFLGVVSGVTFCVLICQPYFLEMRYISYLSAEDHVKQRKAAKDLLRIGSKAAIPCIANLEYQEIKKLDYSPQAWYFRDILIAYGGDALESVLTVCMDESFEEMSSMWEIAMDLGARYPEQLVRIMNGKNAKLARAAQITNMIIEDGWKRW